MESSAQRLLVVEDDVAVARALSRMLARRGYAVATCRSCAAARALAQTFDFAILDLDLPDGNGVTLARDLIAEGKVPSVLFFTGSSDSTMLARARRMGAVVVKAAGTGPVLALLSALTSEHSSPPRSQTAPSAKLRDFRASSSSSLRRQRAR